MPTIEAWFDGCCEPVNPGGHAAYGVVIKINGKTALAEGKYVGEGKGISNNVAEYAGVIGILEFLEAVHGTVTIYGDSKLVINQLSGRWKSHGGHYIPWMERAKEILKPLKDRVRFKWIPREENDACDTLSKQVLRDRGVEFRIQPEAA